MRGRLALIATALAVGGFAAGPAGLPAGAPTSAAARSCSAGYVHGVINGAERCLRRGEFCAHAADRQYRRYGFHCLRRDARGNFHLS